MQALRLTNEDQSIIIDLLGGPITLRSGWEDQTPGMGGSYTYEPYGAQFNFSNYQPVSHSFDLAISGRPNVILAEVDRLQDFLEATRLFHSGDLAAKSCWLEWRTDCDENPKRSLLYSGSFKVISQDDVTPTATKSVIIGRLTLTRHPLWESVPTAWEHTTQFLSYYGTFNTGNISTLGGQYNYTGVPGNTLARPVVTTISSVPAAGVNLSRFWVGIRPFNQGVANFEPVWECEDGTNGTDAADAGDGTASNANKVTVTYVTLTLANRMTITVGQVCAAAGHTDYVHHQGRYLVLLRCKVSAAGTSGIQMRSGYTGNIIADEVYVDNTAWRLIPLGNISIPPWEGSDHSYAAFMQYFRIDIYAEQLTAGHNLDLDCLVLIPNEHLWITEGATIAGGIGSRSVTGRIYEDDKETCYEQHAADVRDSIESSFSDWYIPQGKGMIITAGEDLAQHDLGETMRVDTYYDPRWLLYRTD